MIKNVNMLMGVAALAIAVGFAGVAQAAPIEIFYDSFENPSILPNKTLDNPNPPGWFDVGHPNTSGVAHETNGDFTTPFGDQVLKAWQGQQTGAQKNLGINLEADMEYVLTFNVAKRDNQTNGDYRAELWAGATLLDTVEGLVTTNDMSEAVSHSFDTSAGTLGEPLQLRMIDPSDGQLVNNWRAGPYFDNVRMTMELIPEPASMALLGLGGLMIASRRRR
jgi:hypothetical protein